VQFACALHPILWRALVADATLDTLETGRSPFAVLRHRDFLLLVGGTLVSHTGDLLQSMAVSWLVFELTHSALKLGILGFCWMLPRLIFGALGGVVADRVDRRRLLIITQTVAMLQSIAFLILVVTGHITYGQIVFLSIVLGIADSLHFTARHALVPLLVPRQDLQAAVALNSATMNLTQVLGPSLGGILVGLLHVSGCMLVNAISFVAILAALFAMRFRSVAVERHEQSVAAQIADGFRYVARRESLWVPVVMAYAVAALAMAFSRILPVFAGDVLHGGVGAYGKLQTAMGVGAIVASLGVAVRGGGSTRRLRIAVGGVVGALAVFALSHQLWLSLGALAVVGGSQMVFRTTALALCHEATEDSYRGRVMSIFLLDYGLWSFGTLWLGWISDHHGPAAAVLTGAGSCLLVVVSVVLIARARRA
jgi:MFS family permease